MRKALCTLLATTLFASVAPVWAQDAAPAPAPQATQSSEKTLGQPVQNVPPVAPVPGQLTPVIPLPAGPEPAPVVKPLPDPDLRDPITLERAIELAFIYNPGLRVSVDELNRSRAVVAEARAQFNPKFNGTLVHTIQGPAVTFTAPETDQAVDIVRQQNTEASLSAALPLDINNQLGYATDITKYQFQIDYLSLLTTVERLIFDVKLAYYNLLRAQGQQEVAQAAVDVANARLQNTLARYEAETVPRFDVTRAQVDVANLSQNVIVANNQVATARTTLNRIIGINVNTPTVIVQDEINVTDVELQIPERVETGLLLRPEARTARTLIELNRKNIKLQRAGYLPTADVTAAFNHQFAASGFSTSQDSYIALFTVRVPIWNGGITRARVEQAQYDFARSQNQLEQTELTVSQEVRVAALNLQQAIDSERTTAENVALAEEALRLANIRFEAGISTQVEVIDAESALTQARTNLVNSRYDYAQAVAELQRATSTQPEIQQVQLVEPVVRPMIPVVNALPQPGVTAQ